MVETSNTCKVWSNLKGKRKDGTTVEFRFQELPPERLEEALDLNNKYMLRDEVVHRASGVYKNEEAFQEYKTILNKLVEVNPPHVTICCVEDGSTNGGDLVAVSIMSLDKKTDSLSEFLSLFEINTKEMQTLVKAANVMEDAEDLSQQYDQHYHGKGIVVHPDYRGMGIANEFVRLRRVLCKEQNIPMSAAWMTARGSQRAAEKNDWKTYTELNPQEFSAKTGMLFADDALPFKLMYVLKE